MGAVGPNTQLEKQSMLAVCNPLALTKFFA